MVPFADVRHAPYYAIKREIVQRKTEALASEG
jgi:hypothetical protein